MAKRYLGFSLFVGLFLSSAWTAAQDNETRLRVNVNLVQLNVAVTDHKGDYVTGLRPQDFTVTEDRIPEKIATFEAGNEPTRTVTDTATDTVTSANETVESPGQASAAAPSPVTVSRY